VRSPCCSGTSSDGSSRRSSGRARRRRHTRALGTCRRRFDAKSGSATAVDAPSSAPKAGVTNEALWNFTMSSRSPRAARRRLRTSSYDAAPTTRTRRRSTLVRRCSGSGRSVTGLGLDRVESWPMSVPLVAAAVSRVIRPREFSAQPLGRAFLCYRFLSVAYTDSYQPQLGSRRVLHRHGEGAIDRGQICSKSSFAAQH
jgi:hypothetical protein